MKKNNFVHLIKEEMQNGFDSAIRSEIQEYQNSRKELIKQFENLESEVKSLKNDLQDSLNKNENLSKNLQNVFKQEKQSLLDEFEAQRQLIKENILNTKNFVAKAQDKISGLPGQNDVNEIIVKVYKEINQIKVKVFYESERIIAELRGVIKDQETRFLEKIVSLSGKIENQDKIIETSKLKISDLYSFNSSIMTELNNYKNKAFVQEKKIENLYTLIERLQKRIEP